MSAQLMGADRKSDWKLETPVALIMACDGLQARLAR